MDRVVTVSVDVTDLQGNVASDSSSFTFQEPVASDFDRIVTAGHYSSGLVVPEGQAWKIDGVVTTDANIVSEGALVMRGKTNGGNPQTGDWLKYVGVNEAAFGPGGGLVVVSTDIGLWTMGNGRLDIQGTPKLSWCRLSGGVSAGATSLLLNADLLGWNVGDEIAIAPSEPAFVADHWKHDEVRSITAISGRSVTLSAPLTYSHPATTIEGVAYTAEVENLTRDCGVMGEPGKRAHVFTHTHMNSHTVKYAEFRWLGPRKAAAQGFSDVIEGRWPLHFHHLRTTGTETEVVGCSARDNGSHAYVAHNSTVRFTDCVAYNNMEGSFWWDEPPEHSDGVVYDRCGVIKETSNQKNRRGQLSAFQMQRGDNNAVLNCFVAGVHGAHASGDPAGIHWGNTHADKTFPEKNSVWRAENLVIHNNSKLGIKWWKNDGDFHHVKNSAIYNHAYGNKHGAYENHVLFENVVFGPASEFSADQHAATKDALPRGGYKNCLFTNGIILTGAAGGQAIVPTLWEDCRMSGKVRIHHSGQPGPEPGVTTSRKYDFVRMTVDGSRDLEPSDFVFGDVMPHTVTRVLRRDGSAFQVHSDGSATPIAPF